MNDRPGFTILVSFKALRDRPGFIPFVGFKVLRERPGYTTTLVGY